MSYLTILVASFLATLCLGSPVARQSGQTPVCRGFSEANASNFTLVTVSKDTTFQLPLALGIPPISTAPVLLVIFFLAISLVVSPDMLTGEPIFGCRVPNPLTPTR
jgi:hypothetical protein